MGLIWAGGLLSVLYLLRFCWDGDSWVKTWVKTGALGAPALGLWLMGWPGLFLAGLGACVAGDFLLSRPGQRALMAGIGAFATGHVLYIAAMLGRVETPEIGALLPMFLLLAVSTEFWLIPMTGAMRWPVRIYVVVISAMGIAAALTGQGWLIAGALAFVASDLILSLDLFGQPRGAVAQVMPFTIWALYVLAQVLLAVGFAP